MQTATIEKVCRTSEIAAYIDGELSSQAEFKLEMHFAVCPSCKSKLNEQKTLLCALDFALDNEQEIELPANFTKVIIATAESKVSGLRRPQERFKALFICAALFLLVILGLGSETESVLNTFGKFGDQFQTKANKRKNDDFRCSKTKQCGAKSNCQCYFSAVVSA